MSDVIRKLISKLNLTFVENRAARRHNLQVPVRITIEPDAGEGKNGKLTTRRESLSTSGETKDLSKCGIAFIVPSIRLREYYLVGENRTLQAELDFTQEAGYTEQLRRNLSIRRRSSTNGP